MSGMAVDITISIPTAIVTTGPAKTGNLARRGDTVEIGQSMEEGRIAETDGIDRIGKIDKRTETAARRRIDSTRNAAASRAERVVVVRIVPKDTDLLNCLSKMWTFFAQP